MGAKPQRRGRLWAGRRAPPGGGGSASRSGGPGAPQGAPPPSGGGGSSGASGGAAFPPPAGGGVAPAAASSSWGTTSAPGAEGADKKTLPAQPAPEPDGEDAWAGGAVATPPRRTSSFLELKLNVINFVSQVSTILTLRLPTMATP